MMDQQVKQKNIKEKRFSIIVPVYNVEEYITRCIDSIKKQTFKSYEVIIIDSGSTDNTNNIIKELLNENMIFIQNNEDKGPGGARNTGLDNATGEYIIFLDADDYFNNNKVLEKLNETIGKNNPDVIYMGFQFSGNRKELIIPTLDKCDKKYKVALDKYPNVWSKCWNRNLIECNKIRFQENMYYEDVLFLYKAVMKSNTYLIADYPVHTYTSGRKNSITTTLTFKNIYDTVKNIEEMVKLKQEEPTEELDIIIKKEINMCKKRLEQLINL